MTTNGVGLAKIAGSLRDAGMTRVNVSLDTLRRDVFLDLAKRDRLADTLEGIRAAAEAGLAPVKLNTVLKQRLHDGSVRFADGLEHRTALGSFNLRP